uniref:Shootin-1 n=1 Tax=Leptobrachium leishanense TaxID=445787 RepID=A0A8C5WFF7_9ANUR
KCGESFSHKVIEEVSFIEKNLEIEKTCRESAEALASKLNKENKTLKRISMMCMAKLGPDAITEEINLDEDDSTPGADAEITACTSLQCQQRFKELQEQVLAAQREKQTASSELDDLRSRLLDFIEEVMCSCKQSPLYLCALPPPCFPYNLSMLAVEEYEELQTNLEMEKDLREKAESLAQEMYIEQKKLKRQSQLLLQSSVPSEQLLKALEENAKLTQALEEERMRHQQKVKELEEKLDQDRLLMEIESLRRQLDLLEEDRKDLESKYLSSESTIRNLKHSVDALQKRVQQAENPPPPPPPPPPPLPPPPPITHQAGCRGDILPRVLFSPGNIVDIKKQAVDEMMARIKDGVRLRPVQNVNRLKTKVSIVPLPGW